MSDESINSILILAIIALLGGLAWMAVAEWYHYEAVASAQPVDLDSGNIANFVGKPVRLTLVTTATDGVTTSSGQPFAYEQAVFIHSHRPESSEFLPSQGLVLTDRAGKLKLTCKSIDLSYCALLYRGRTAEGANMLPVDWQDDSHRDALFTAGALPLNCKVTAIGIINAIGEMNAIGKVNASGKINKIENSNDYELGPITVPLNAPVTPIVSTLKEETILAAWSAHILATLTIKSGLLLAGLLIAVVTYQVRKSYASLHEQRMYR